MKILRCWVASIALADCSADTIVKIAADMKHN